MEEEWKPILSSKVLDGDMGKQLYSSWLGKQVPRPVLAFLKACLTGLFHSPCTNYRLVNSNIPVDFVGE